MTIYLKSLIKKLHRLEDSILEAEKYQNYELLDRLESDLEIIEKLVMNQTIKEG